MKAIVTGGAGFIGSHIVDALVSRGDEVVCIDDESAPQNQSFFWNKSALNVRGDIRDHKLRCYYEKADVVFHLAARSRIQPTVGNPAECFSVNTMGTQEVLESCRLAGVKRVVYSASSSFYGNINKPPFNEKMQPGCATPYSLSKWQGEQICDLYTRLYGISTASLRYFNVYGPREPIVGQYAPVVGLFMRQKKAGEPMTVVGDGNQRRDFTHVEDVVAANILASQRNDATGVFNIGTGINHSIIDIAKIIGGEIVHISERVGETRETLADFSRARDVLGWNPTISFVDYIGEKVLNIA